MSSTTWYNQQRLVKNEIQKLEQETKARTKEESLGKATVKPGFCTPPFGHSFVGRRPAIAFTRSGKGFSELTVYEY